jgi:hypothetical protein
LSVQPAAISGRSNYLTILEEAWQAHLAPRAADAPTVISTFAGAGGSSLGYSMAGYRELLAVEWDDNAVETFRLNFPDVPVYHGDIAKLSVEQVLDMTGYGRDSWMYSMARRHVRALARPASASWTIRAMVYSASMCGYSEDYSRKCL